MSHGGLPSRAWAKAVNDAYDRGVVIVAASGDCYLGLPTRNVVYPARFRRVLIGCGVTSAGGGYHHNAFIMQGYYGPASVMDHALAAYTPNVLWAKGQPPSDPVPHNNIQMNGAGTSSSTPQIAAAAALWLARHRALVSQPGQPAWRKVEAVRSALLGSAKPDAANAEYFGRGTLKALDAVDDARAAQIVTQDLVQTPEDDVSFPFFRTLLGLAEPEAQTARERMFETEATQIAVRGESNLLSTALNYDDGDSVASNNREAVLSALTDSPHASHRLRQFIAQRR